MLGRTRWVVSFLVALSTAAVLSAATLARDDGGGDDACEEWRRRYEAAFESVGIDPESVGTGTLQFVNLGPLAGLEESRPEGCAPPG
ncbi:MAG TPA: hypothetical protein VHN37_05620 [Actinomycetota bacterium]|nr:hypothetical protein [Actinomycetota bacterium]